MTPQGAMDYIENYTWSTTRLGLERTQELLLRMGNPQKTLKFVHVAGSNGKGSTCAMLDAVLRSAGYRVGLYISPYLQDFCERIQVNGQNIPGEELAQITEKYYRGSNASGRVGYGLGMYLVRWYMEKQGGGMEYYNDNGFVVELLVKKV